MRIYLARHGETDWNAQQRLQGWTDIPLNENGRRQANELAQRMDGVQLDSIYCSALKRSIETAESLHCEPVIRMADLNEQSLGKFEGMRLDGPGLDEFQRRRADQDDSLDGGESVNQHFLRVTRAIHTIREQHSYDSAVLIVGHGGTNSMILRYLFDARSDLAFKIANHDLFLIDLPARGRPALWKYFTIQ